MEATLLYSQLSVQDRKYPALITRSTLNPNLSLQLPPLQPSPTSPLRHVHGPLWDHSLQLLEKKNCCVSPESFCPQTDNLIAFLYFRCSHQESIVLNIFVDSPETMLAFCFSGIISLILSVTRKSELASCLHGTSSWGYFILHFQVQSCLGYLV